MTKLILTFISTILFAITVNSQTDTIHSFAKHHYWASIGAGYSDPLYLNYDLGATYLLKNKHAFQINYFGLGSHASENTLHDLHSVILSYGISKSDSYFHSFLFSTGISYGQGTYYGQDTATKINYNWVAYVFLLAQQPHKYIQTKYEYFGLYLSGQYLLRTRFYGLGLKIYCNIHKYTDYGITLSQNVGYLNKRRKNKNKP